MSDDPRHPNPSGGLVSNIDTDLDGLTADTPDAFGEPMDEASLENELPEEGIYPGDTDFEQALEDYEIERYGEV